MSADPPQSQQAPVAGTGGSLRVKQVLNNVTEAGHKVAGVTSTRLLSAGHPGSILFGPRSPRYETD